MWHKRGANCTVISAGEKRNETIMSRRCPSCQAENAPQDQYCFQCGHSLRLQRPHTVILSTRRRFAGEDSDTPANTRPAPAIPPANASANPTTESEATTQEPTTGSAVADLDDDLTLTHPVPTDGAMVETAPTIIPALDTPVAAGVAPDVAETDDAHDTSDDPTAPLPWACAQCGTVNPAEDEYCSKCGAMNAPIPNKVTLTPPEVVPVAADTRKGWRLRTGWGTNVGTARKGGVDEDSVFAMTLSRAFAEHPETFGAFVVADGMGGQAAGEVASKMAIETIAAAVLRELGAAWVGGGALESEAIETTLRNAITAAHERITQSNSDDGNDKGTTVTMAVICDGVMHVANSGDSRTYLFGRGPGLIRVSHDHSLVQTLVDAGNDQTR